MIDYSDELKFDGTLFTYFPESGFSGVKNFYYTIIEGQKEMRGNIELYIGDYLPLFDHRSQIAVPADART